MLWGRAWVSTTSVVVFAAATAVVAWNIFTAQRSSSNGCIMTYMRPQYVPTPISDQRRGYTLEQYTEGSVRAAERAHPDLEAPGIIIHLLEIDLAPV